MLLQDGRCACLHKEREDELQDLNGVVCRARSLLWLAFQSCQWNVIAKSSSSPSNARSPRRERILLWYFVNSSVQTHRVDTRSIKHVESGITERKKGLIINLAAYHAKAFGYEERTFRPQVNTNDVNSRPSLFDPSQHRASSVNSGHRLCSTSMSPSNTPERFQRCHHSCSVFGQ